MEIETFRLKESACAVILETHVPMSIEGMKKLQTQIPVFLFFRGLNMIHKATLCLLMILLTAASAMANTQPAQTTAPKPMAAPPPQTQASTLQPAANPSIKGIMLYDKPDLTSNVVATIQPGQPLIPIFSQNDWIKVGNPQNGDVGWVSDKTFNELGIPKIYIKTYSQNNPGQQNSGYQIIQYSGRQMDTKQFQSMVAMMQNQQDNTERAFNQLISQSIANFNELARQLQQMQNFNNMQINTHTASIPATTPVIIIHEQPVPATQQPAKKSI